MSQPITTTLKRIREHGPCESGWEKLLRALGKTGADEEPLALLTILDTNGLSDAIWCLRACGGIDRQARLFAVECAEQVKHLIKDDRSLRALKVARDYAEGRATETELTDAWYDAFYAAWSAACDASWSATWAAARDASLDAFWAADKAAACDAAGDAARVKQEAVFRRIFAAKEGRDAK